MHQSNISGARQDRRVQAPRKVARQAKRRRGHGGAVALAVASSTAAGAATLFCAPDICSAAGTTKTGPRAGGGNGRAATKWGGTAPAVTGDSVNITDIAAGIKTVTFDGSVTTTSLNAMTVGGTASTFVGQMTLQFPAGSP